MATFLRISILVAALTLLLPAARARGCNFATLFPVWDMLFRTANFERAYPATGIRDQLEGVDYGRGFWAQQWLALRRMVGRPSQAADRNAGAV